MLEVEDGGWTYWSCAIYQFLDKGGDNEDTLLRG